MVSVLFDSINSATDLGLFLTDVKISEPEPKRTTVNVPCMDGMLDLSYALSSKIRYKNRKIKFIFKKTDYSNSWMSVFSAVANKLHGKQMTVSVSNDNGYTWDCFVTVNPESAYNVGTIKVDCDAYPYKEKDVELTTTATSVGVSVSADVSAESVVPTVTCSSSITITDNGTTYVFLSGTTINPNFVLDPGTHVLLVKGSGTVKIVYHDRSL